MKKIHCSILTPERHIYEGEIDFAVVQAYDGERGFLVNHAPLVSQLGIGEVRLSYSKKTDFYIVEGGVVEIRNNKLIILAETAQNKDELDKKQLETRLKELKDIPFSGFNKEWFNNQKEQNSVKVKIRIASR